MRRAATAVGERRGCGAAAATDRPATAPSGAAVHEEDASLRELRERAEQAHQELVEKTRELEALESALANPSGRAVARSLSDLALPHDDEAERRRRRADAAAAPGEAHPRSVIERNLRQIRRLEGDPGLLFLQSKAQGLKPKS